MTIAKKLGYDKPWLAWIPIANFFLLPILAKKNWKLGFIIFAPFIPVLIGFVIPLIFQVNYSFDNILLILVLIIRSLVSIFLFILVIIWLFKIFKQRNYPGWLSLISILSYSILYHFFISIYTISLMNNSFNFIVFFNIIPILLKSPLLIPVFLVSLIVIGIVAWHDKDIKSNTKASESLGDASIFNDR